MDRRSFIGAVGSTGAAALLPASAVGSSLPDWHLKPVDMGEEAYVPHNRGYGIRVPILGYPSGPVKKWKNG